MALLRPDRFFSGITSIDIKADLLDCGLTCALLDMDNTIVSRETHDVPQDVREWLEEAKRAGVSLCLLSNNWHTTPFEWSKKLDIPVVAKACKPLPHGYIAARDIIGGRSRNTVAIGDQLGTDVLGAHMLGMAAYLVEPLAETDLRHTLALRHVERLILGEMKPESGLAIR